MTRRSRTWGASAVEAPRVCGVTGYLAPTTVIAMFALTSGCSLTCTV